MFWGAKHSWLWDFFVCYHVFNQFECLCHLYCNVIFLSTHCSWVFTLCSIVLGTKRAAGIMGATPIICTEHTAGNFPIAWNMQRKRCQAHFLWAVLLCIQLWLFSAAVLFQWGWTPCMGWRPRLASVIGWWFRTSRCMRYFSPLEHCNWHLALMEICSLLLYIVTQTCFSLQVRLHLILADLMNGSSVVVTALSHFTAKAVKWDY